MIREALQIKTKKKRTLLFVSMSFFSIEQEACIENTICSFTAESSIER